MTASYMALLAKLDGQLSVFAQGDTPSTADNPSIRIPCITWHRLYDPNKCPSIYDVTLEITRDGNFKIVGYFSAPKNKPDKRTPHSTVLSGSITAIKRLIQRRSAYDPDMASVYDETIGETIWERSTPSGTDVFTTLADVFNGVNTYDNPIVDGVVVSKTKCEIKISAPGSVILYLNGKFEDICPPLLPGNYIW